MSTVKGVIQKVNSKDFNGKKIWSIKVNDTWYGAGYNQPKVNEGENVEFETTQRGQYWNVDGPINVLAASSASPATGGAKADGWAAKQAADEARQKIIQIQSSRNSAIEVVKIIVQAGALKLPTKQADQVDVILALVDELTDKYNKDTSDLASFGERRNIGEQAAEQAPGEDF